MCIHLSSQAFRSGSTAFLEWGAQVCLSSEHPSGFSSSSLYSLGASRLNMALCSAYLGAVVLASTRSPSIRAGWLHFEWISAPPQQVHQEECKQMKTLNNISLLQ